MRTDALAAIDRMVARGGYERGFLRVAAEIRGVTMAELSRVIDCGNVDISCSTKKRPRGKLWHVGITAASYAGVESGTA